MKTGWMIIRAYYWATPVFLLLDLFFGIDVRVSAFIDKPVWRFAYYGFCFLCLGAIEWKPPIAHYVGLLESLTNVTILIFGMWMPLIVMDQQALNDQPIVNPVTRLTIINFLLAGGIGISSFYQCIFDINVRLSKSQPQVMTAESNDESSLGG